MQQVNFDINKAYTLLTEKIEEWMKKTGIKMLPNLVVAILVLVLFVMVGKLVKQPPDRLLRRITDNESLCSLLSSIIYVTIIAIGTFIALSINLDGAITSLLAGAGVISLALCFAFQDIASKFMAGGTMSMPKSFREGDLIEANDFFGIVKKIHLRTTEMQTIQGQMILIPNSMVFKNPVTNYIYTGRRRIGFDIGVTYDPTLSFAQEVAKKAVQAPNGWFLRMSAFFTRNCAIRTLEVDSVDFNGIFSSYSKTTGGTASGGSEKPD